MLLVNMTVVTMRQLITVIDDFRWTHTRTATIVRSHTSRLHTSSFLEVWGNFWTTRLHFSILFLRYEGLTGKYMRTSDVMTRNTNKYLIWQVKTTHRHIILLWKWLLLLFRLIHRKISTCHSTSPISRLSLSLPSCKTHSTLESPTKTRAFARRPSRDAVCFNALYTNSTVAGVELRIDQICTTRAASCSNKCIAGRRVRCATAYFNDFSTA